MMLRAVLAGMALIALALAGPAHGATLGLAGDGVLFEAERCTVSVMLELAPDEAVAGFQFDLQFDSGVLVYEKAEAGERARGAEKSAHANEIRPGLLRVVVAGFNQNTIASGSVVSVSFAGALGLNQAANLHLSNVILSDPFGVPVSVEVAPDTLVLRESSAMAVDTEGTDGATSEQQPGAVLYRYRAVIFAAIVVGFTMLLARSKPKKGRVR